MATREVAIELEYPPELDPVHFIRLTLARGDEIVSLNTYWRGPEDGKHEALRELPNVDVESETRAEREADRWVLTTELHNPSSHPALMVRVKAVRATSGDRDERPRVVVEGFNTVKSAQPSP